MKYSKSESAAAVILEPAKQARAAVIWLHGLGADGNDFVPVVDQLQLAEPFAVRFIFPHARARPVTINNGYVMRAWYDIKDLTRATAEDEAGIRESAGVIRQYIEREMAAGVAADAIVIAGFSQGGAIALQTALRFPQTLAGVMALSTYLPLQATLAQEAHIANRKVPILMCHGRNDAVLPLQLGELSREVLTHLGYAVEWRTYRMEHSVCAEEIIDISRWLQSVLKQSCA